MWIIERISSFNQIAQWLECVHGKHMVAASNSLGLTFYIVLKCSLNVEHFTG